MGAYPASYPAEATVEPPGAPKVLGILSIIFGAVVAVFTLFSLVNAVNPISGIPSTSETFRMAEALERFAEETRTASLISGFLMLIMSTSLIIIGIGQLKYRKWAARASVIWGVIALGVVVIEAVIQSAIIGPAAAAMVADMMASDPAMPDISAFMSGISGLASVVGIVSTALFHAPYPIILIVFFRKPKIAGAMTH